MRYSLHSPIVVWTVVILTCTPSLGRSAMAGEIRRDLGNHLKTLGDVERISIIIHLKEQADIDALDLALRQERATRAERHERVVRALREVASRTQPALIAYLNEERDRGNVAGFTPYWISNMIIAHATVEEIRRLADHPSVGFIEPNFRYTLIEPVTPGRSRPGRRGIGISEGLRAINADRVWHELGITGAGRIVANLDTGVDGNHPALASRWRGNQPGVDPGEAWFDPITGSSFPFDTYGHGTPVMGIMTGLGGTTADTIGVAWGALWIASNAINQDEGEELDNDIIDALQWFADPDGNPQTVDDVPDCVQNSWGVNESIPGYTDCDGRWNSAIDNCEATGVVLIFAAGNEGPAPGSLLSPADRADTPFNCFAVGAVDATNNEFPYPIAYFSSRGPSGCDGISIKPEVVAPGINIYSSIPGGGYQQEGVSGTSFAGPHVTGVVALMREANPDLTMDEIKEVLMASSHDFGPPGEENTYGAGFIDAYEAVIRVMGGVGLLTGTVTDALTHDPVPAVLEIPGAARMTTADPETGEYSFFLLGDSSYTIQASYLGYEVMQQTTHIAPDDTTVLDFALEPGALGSIVGAVVDPSTSSPIPARLTLYMNGDSLAIVETDSLTGTYAFDGINVSSPPWVIYTDLRVVPCIPYPVVNYGDTILVEEGAPTVIDFTILPANVFLVDDDEGEGYEEYYKDEIASTGRTYRHFDVQNVGESPANYLDRFPPSSVVLWFTGDASANTLSEAEQDSLAGFLDNGGKLFLTGQNICEDLAAAASEFLADYLHVSYDGNVTYFLGMGDQGNPITGFLKFFLTTGGDGANNQVSRDRMIAGAPATEFIYYISNPGDLTPRGTAAAYVEGQNGYMAILMGFGFEAITRAGGDTARATREETMLAILNWFDGITGTGRGDVTCRGGLLPKALALLQNYPNPFNPSTTIRYEIPGNALENDQGAPAVPVELALFDTRGRLLKRLVDGPQAPGAYQVHWDGMDHRNRPVCSGIYLYRLTAGERVLTRKMIVMR